MKINEIGTEQEYISAFFTEICNKEVLTVDDG